MMITVVASTTTQATAPSWSCHCDCGARSRSCRGTPSMARSLTARFIGGSRTLTGSRRKSPRVFGSDSQRLITSLSRSAGLHWATSSHPQSLSPPSPKLRHYQSPGPSGGQPTRAKDIPRTALRWRLPLVRSSLHVHGTSSPTPARPGTTRSCHGSRSDSLLSGRKGLGSSIGRSPLDRVRYPVHIYSCIARTSPVTCVLFTMRHCSVQPRTYFGRARSVNSRFHQIAILLSISRPLNIVVYRARARPQTVH